jgi:hypothetical protein
MCTFQYEKLLKVYMFKIYNDFQFRVAITLIYNNQKMLIFSTYSLLICSKLCFFGLLHSSYNCKQIK